MQMFRGRAGTVVGEGVISSGVAVTGAAVGVGVGVDPPQAASRAKTASKLDSVSTDRRKDMVVLPWVRFMDAIIQQTASTLLKGDQRIVFGFYLTALIKSASRP